MPQIPFLLIKSNRICISYQVEKMEFLKFDLKISFSKFSFIIALVSISKMELYSWDGGGVESGGEGN